MARTALTMQTPGKLHGVDLAEMTAFNQAAGVVYVDYSAESGNVAAIRLPRPRS